MYLQHTIVPGGLANIGRPDGTVTGFRLQVRIGFPRGMPLSMVEGFDVDIDSGVVQAGPTEVLFRLRDVTYRADDLTDLMHTRWEMGEVAELRVAYPGGLTPGTHEITVAQYLRVGATPEPARTVGSRTLELSPLVILDGPATNHEGAQA